MQKIHLLHLKQQQHLLGMRQRAAHKGCFGHVLVMGGYHGMGGAVRLAAEAAVRVGAGLVSVVTLPQHVAAVIAGRPELMCYGLDIADTENLDLDTENLDLSVKNIEKNHAHILELLKRVTVIVIGPGLGQAAFGKVLLHLALSAACPLIVDADALNLLAQQPKQHSNWILTPHPGEAARLLKKTVEEIQQNRITAAQALQQKYAGIIVLKGAGTIVQGSETYLCQAGNPGMASGGMGDVLSGVIAGLVAQELPLAEAAKTAVCLHATAADRAALAGERGLLALDLMPHLQSLVNP